MNLTHDPQFRLAIAREKQAHVFVNSMPEERRLLVNGIVRTFCGARVPGAQADAVMRHPELAKRSFAPTAGTLGATLLPIGVSRDILNIADVYGAFSDLGVTPMSNFFTKFAKLATLPKAYWITPNNIGGALPIDTQLSGSSLTPEANTLSVVIQISEELLQDEKADLAPALIQAAAQGLATLPLN